MGALNARKVAGERDGLVWEIALEATGQPDKTDRTSEAATGQPGGQNDDLTARYLARLESENDFLQRAREAAQQSEAVTKAALREALKIAPRQLPEPEPLAQSSGFAQPVCVDVNGKAGSIELYLGRDVLHNETKRAR